MRWEDLRSSDNVEDRRGEGGGGGGGMGVPGGGAGGLGIGAIVVVLIISYFTGINPAILIGGAQQIGGGGRSQQEQVDPQTQATRRQPPTDESGRFASKILGNTEDVWNTILPQQT
ncbi:MAG: neutral zinc metallopeptidase, partial [Methylobacterium sp.]